MPVATAPGVRRLSFSHLAAFPKLFAAYCRDCNALSDFYAGDFRDPAARRTAAERAASHDRDRDALVEVLLEQNAHLAGDTLDDGMRERIETLRAPESIAVVTGQQVGLFTGPLYTLYKTLTVLRLGGELAEETGRPVVPVFWLEGEDHDFDEVASVQLLRRNDSVRVHYEGPVPPEGGNLGPVGRLRLTEEIEQVLAQVDEVLPPSDFKPSLMEHLCAAYRPGATLLEAFARLLRAILPDGAAPVFINPDDRRLKMLAAPLFRREIEEPEASTERVQVAGERLEKAGYHQQVQARPANIFLLDEGSRRALDYAGGRFALRNREQTFSQKELLDLLEKAPDRFSPNVVLRPLVQDILLPTAVYVAGPSEVSYFAQYRAVYEWADVPMPLIHPRASVTLVEGKVQKVLDAFGLDLPDFESNLDQLFQRVVVEQMEADVEAVFGEAVRPMHETLNALKPEVEAVDGSLAASVEAVRAAVMQEMDGLKRKVVRAEKRGRDEARARLDKARVNLFPGGTLQERAVSPLYFLNKYSLDLPGHLHRTLSLDTTAHQVVEL